MVETLQLGFQAETEISPSYMYCKIISTFKSYSSIFNDL